MTVKLAISSRSGSWRSYVGLALFVALFASIPVADRLKNGSHGEAYHQQLLQEFRRIQPLPVVVAVGNTDSYSPWRPRQALVQATYKTNASYNEIRQFYDQQLRANGWRPLDERGLTGWGKDLGGRETEYCKGPLKASLQYAGSQADYGWTFAFSLSWGLGLPKCG
jgi:hypothetical protein